MNWAKSDKIERTIFWKVGRDEISLQEINMDKIYSKQLRKTESDSRKTNSFYLCKNLKPNLINMLIGIAL